MWTWEANDNVEERRMPWSACPLSFLQCWLHQCYTCCPLASPHRCYQVFTCNLQSYGFKKCSAKIDASPDRGVWLTQQKASNARAEGKMWKTSWKHLEKSHSFTRTLLSGDYVNILWLDCVRAAWGERASFLCSNMKLFGNVIKTLCTEDLDKAELKDVHRMEAHDGGVCEQ